MSIAAVTYLLAAGWISLCSTGDPSFMFLDHPQSPVMFFTGLRCYGET